MQSPPRSPSAPIRVLLVDRLPERLLQLHDLPSNALPAAVDIDHATSFAQAVSCLKCRTYDLVLCNCQAPAEIDYSSPHVPVLDLVSGNPYLGEPSSRHLVHGATELLREQNEDMLRMFKGAVEHAPEMIAITDSSGIVEYVNAAFEALTGYSRQEVIGRTLRLLRSDEEKPEVYEAMWQAILTRQIFHGTVSNRKKSGETFLAEKTIVPLPQLHGEKSHFVSYDRDITEQRNLESQLRQAQKMDAIGRLAGGIAHDFNNLLLVISADAELMIDSLGQHHPLRTNVQQIITASQRAADLTRQLLVFGRKQAQVLSVLDLNAVLQEINRMLPRLIGEDIELRLIPGDNLGKIKADRVQIEQIVMNLAANARDAMPQGGRFTIQTTNVCLDETCRQRHSIVPAGNYVLLTLTDTGQGILPEHLPYIFEPFYTTKEEGRGTGLGLATVYEIVKQNSGFIWVNSESEHGTTFKIYLPRTEEAGQAPALPIANEHSIEGHETILLVEDEELVRISTADFLGSKGYKVLQAQNGQEGLRAAQNYEEQIDLTITDVVMPHLCGTALIERLRTGRPNMKVLFISGYAENTVLQHGSIDVSTQFLAKPFSLKTLVWKVRQILGKKVSQATSTSA